MDLMASNVRDDLRFHTPSILSKCKKARPECTTASGATTNLLSAGHAIEETCIAAHAPQLLEASVAA
jgi:hypothetical protein